MANPRLPNITEAEQELLYEKLNVYNQGKASYKEAGCYLVVLPREGHPDYSLWFYTPLLDRAVHLVYRRFETGHYPVAAHRHFRIVVCQPTDPGHGLQ